MSGHLNPNRHPAEQYRPVEARIRRVPNVSGQAAEKLNAYGVDALCDDVLNGLTLTQIARNVEVSIASLLVWRDAQPERSARVREARTIRAELWDELAIAEIRAATDKLSMDKAREIAHHYRWRAAKTNPKEYGDKIDATITFNSGLAERLAGAVARATGRTIDVEPEQDAIEGPSEVVPRAD